jgi:hypothetical protein
MIEVFRGSYLKTMDIKNLLENNNILVFTINESMSKIDLRLVSAGSNTTTILKVQEENYNNAKKIIEYYNNREHSLILYGFNL